ncbi:MAG: XRE family transcriptional regulator [Gammaproteobacteria bacterium]|nr:XRE family transcriptional regulator [Gammaproteobacteria bacterium]
MPRVEATPNPDVLKWARESAGYDFADVARRLRTSEDRVRGWEENVRRPTLGQLRKIAAMYRRPLALFYLPEPPRSFRAMHDFRHLPGAVPTESPALRLEIRRAWERRDIALELLADLDEEPAGVPVAVTLDDNVEDTATRVRQWLGVSPGRQREWGKAPHAALNGWRTTLEAHGVLALQAIGVPLREMRGFSIAERPLPIAVANIQDAPRGRVFTLLHELVHILLRENGLCDERDVDDVDRGAEGFCNRVAAAILVPESDLRESETVIRHGRGVSWSEQELSGLSRRFGGASEEALLLRMVRFGLTTQHFYRERREHLRQRYTDQRERDAGQGGFVPPHRVSMAALGRTFVRLVLEGFDRERISASDVADFLGMRLKHLEEVRSDMRRVP